MTTKQKATFTVRKPKFGKLTPGGFITCMRDRPGGGMNIYLREGHPVTRWIQVKAEDLGMPLQKFVRSLLSDRYAPRHKKTWRAS